MSYAAQKKLVIGFLCFYFIAGMYVVDSYPFFNWGLFTHIPNEQNDFTIEIRSFDGTVYDTPLPFSESRFLFDAIGQSPTEYTQPISDLGRALLSKDSATVETKRRYIERMFDGKPFSYTVLRITYDPVQLWRTGAHKSKQEIVTFDSNYAL